jgi:hypothetical protein
MSIDGDSERSSGAQASEWALLVAKSAASARR